MLLENKTAILYGAGGHIGRAVAEAFAHEGAKLFLTGRNSQPLQAIADELGNGGGKAEVAEVDALDAESVDAHLTTVVEKTGGLDISFNMISLKDVQGQELAAMSIEDNMKPIEIAARSQFITATAAARHMTKRGRGVIMTITATPARLALPLVGGFGTACGTIEGMMRTLAAEVGPKGVHVCWLRSAGSPESFPPDASIADPEFQEKIRTSTLLKRFPKLDEIGGAAALMASDRAGAMTGAAFNITCGQIVD